MVASVSVRGDWKQHLCTLGQRADQKTEFVWIDDTVEVGDLLESGESIQIEKVAGLDDSPFYQRVQIQMTCDGRRDWDSWNTWSPQTQYSVAATLYSHEDPLSNTLGPSFHRYRSIE